MFTLKLSGAFRRQALAFPFPRGVVAGIAPSRRGAHAGAYVSLGAIALGGALMVANIAHERGEQIPVVAAPPITSPATIRSVALDPPRLAAPPPSPPSAPAAEKTAERIDTSPIAAIPDSAKLKPKHKRHKRKAKALSDQP